MRHEESEPGASFQDLLVEKREDEESLLHTL